MPIKKLVKISTIELKQIYLCTFVKFPTVKHKFPLMRTIFQEFVLRVYHLGRNIRSGNQSFRKDAGPRLDGGKI